MLLDLFIYKCSPQKTFHVITTSCYFIVIHIYICGYPVKEVIDKCIKCFLSHGSLYLFKTLVLF